MAPVTRRVTGGLLLGLGGFALVASAIPARADASDPRAVAALERAAQAAHAQSYRGTQYVATYSASGSSSVVLDVQHTAGQGSVLTVLSPEARGGPVWTADARLPGTAELAVPGLDGGSLQLLQQTYDLQLDPTEALCVVARRQDGRPAARFWLDADSGLLVRREVYDSAGHVVRSSALVNLRLSQPAAVLASDAPAMSLVAASSERHLDLQEITALAEHGWTVPRVLPGQLVLYDVRMHGDGEQAVVHLSYSDGLTTMSVFEQRGRLDTAAVKDWHRGKVSGATVWWEASAVPTRAVWTSRGRVWTVLTDAPMESVRDVVGRLPHDKPHHRTFWERIGHGLARLASWLNPFD